MSTIYHDENFNYFYETDGLLYVGNGSKVFQNGAYNKNIVNAFLPSKFNNVLIYGTFYRCLASLPSLVSIFIPKTYKVIQADLFLNAKNVASVELEQNSELIYIGGWMGLNSKITSFTFPPSLKYMHINQSFFGCTNLKTIYYQGMLQPKYDDVTFWNVPEDLIIYVRKDYPYDTFAGRKITRILNPIPKITCIVRRKYAIGKTNIQYTIY